MELLLDARNHVHNGKIHLHVITTLTFLPFQENKLNNLHDYEHV